jgi:transcriptional antiterminator NusG
VPLSAGELRSLGIRDKMPSIDIKVGEAVKVLAGPFEGFTGVVEEVNIEKRKIKANISMFGRETPVELEFVQISKI